MKQAFIETANVTALRHALGVLEDTEKGQPGLAVVHGRAGRGKTAAALRLYTTGRDGVYLRVWQDWTQTAFLRALCWEVAQTRQHSAELNKMKIIEALSQHRRTIWVDEADRLNPGRIEDLRDIHDETGCPVVFVGEQELYAAMSARRRLWSRVTWDLPFGPVAAEDILTFALDAAGLRLSAEACGLVAEYGHGDFRLVYRIVQRLEQAAAAAQTDRVESRMVKAVGQGGLGGNGKGRKA